MAEPGSRERVLEALKPLGLVMARPELGGTGLLLNGSVFGVLHSGLVYLKVDKKQREEYHEAGMRPLEPRPKQKLDAFLQVPLAIVEDDAKLLEHAARAAGRPVPKTPPAPRRGATSPPTGEGPTAAQPAKRARTTRSKAAKTKE